MISLKKLFALSAICLTAAFPLCVRAQTPDYVKADWKFSQSQVASGSVESGAMTVTDASGNGNDLEMRTYGSDYARTASFTQESLTGGGSIFLNGGINGAVDTNSGIDFVTKSGAPINSQTFPNGYTIEIIYKMPDDWSNADRWTSLLSRLGSSNGAIDDEGEAVTSVVHVSNCKEIQFIPASAKNQNNLSSNVWSVAMDKAENWYSIVISYDNNTFKTFINGAESFRNIDCSSMAGLYADPSDGRFRIGARVKNGTPYRFTRGYIQEIRISDKALDRQDWLVPNPEEYLGEYGSNRPFDMPKGDSYNFIFLPDMQNAIKFKNDVIETAMNWIVENKDAANIEAVVSLGDNVQDTCDLTQWENVAADMSILPKNGVRTLVQPGNHDTNYGADHNTWYFTSHFGKDSDFQKLVSDYVECSAPSGMSYVMDVPAGSFDYKVISIDMYALADGSDVQWLREQLEKYPSNPVIIVSHDIQNSSDTEPNETKLSANGSTLWNIVRDYDNVFMMAGGHSHGYGVLELENTYGHKVFSVLADYQFSYNGGNALFKFAEFDEANNRIHLTTFSPYVASLEADKKGFFDVNYMTGKGHDDYVEFNFAERLGNLSVLTKGENLIANGSFEENTEGWTNNNAGNIKALSEAGWIRSTDYAKDGKYSLMQNSGEGNGGSSDLNLCTFIPIEAGKKYTLSYWEYSTVNHPDDYWRMSACVVVKDKGALGSGIELMDCGGRSSWGTNSDGRRDAAYYQGWTHRTYTFDTTNAPDAKYIMIAYAWGDAGTLYIDDFSLCELTVETVKTVTVTAAEAVRDGDAVNVSVTCDISACPEALVIAAGYDENGKLVSAGFVKDGETALTGSNITDVRIFCWEGADMKPLTRVKVAQWEEA